MMTILRAFAAGLAALIVTACDISTLVPMENPNDIHRPSLLATYKDITDFSFDALDPVPLGVVGEASDGSGTVDVVVPWGTPVTALVPTIAINGATISPASGTAQDFTTPVSYVVTAKNGTQKVWKVTVTVAENTAKDILSFSIGVSGSTVDLNEAAGTIDVEVPFGTVVTSLTPTFTVSGSSVTPSSGVAQNFTSPVTYTVTAANGSTKEFVVTVTAKGDPAKEITSFNIPGVTQSSSLGTGTVTITSTSATTGTISVGVPSIQNVTALSPVIVHNGESISPASGAGRNFTNPVVYTVTAADGSTKAWTVTVHKLPTPPTPSPEDESFPQHLHVSWTAVTNATSYTVYYDDTAIDTSDLAASLSVTTSSTSIDLEGLTSYTIYYIRVTATLPYGTTAPSASANLRTVSGTIGVSSNVTIGGTGLNVNGGTATADQGLSFEAVPYATGYRIWYSQSADPENGSDYQDISVTPETNVGPISVTVTQLPVTYFQGGGAAGADAFGPNSYYFEVSVIRNGYVYTATNSEGSIIISQ